MESGLSFGGTKVFPSSELVEIVASNLEYEVCSTSHTAKISSIEG